MKNTNSNYKENQLVTLLTAVSIHHSPEIAASIANRFGDFQTISRWEMEEMNDDLLSILNEAT